MVVRGEIDQKPLILREPPPFFRAQGERHTRGGEVAVTD